MRLLQCHTCRTLDAFPDPPRGVDPHNISPGEDPLLDELVARHKTNGMEHIGNLIQVPDEHWNNTETRKEIVAQIGSGKTGFEEEFYATRDTFTEDALKCFAEHHRPERCIDWLSDRKRLGRATPEGKAWAKQNQKAPSTYLCHFCPVASKVAQAKRDAHVPD